MHGVGKIDQGGAMWQLHDFTCRCKDINGIRKQIKFDVFEEFKRVTGMFLHLQQLTQPFTRAGLHLVNIFFTRLVAPVCRHTGFRHPVHFFCADLDLDRNTVGSKQDRVQ